MTYQATQGSYFWFYVAAVCVETANSIATMVLWGIVLMFATCSTLFLDGLGNEGTFYLFAGLCFLGSLTFCIVMQEIKGMTKEQQQTLYSEVKEDRNANETGVNKSESKARV